MKALMLALAGVATAATTLFVTPQAEAQGGVYIRPGRPGYYCRPYDYGCGRPGYGIGIGFGHGGHHGGGWGGRPGWGHGGGHGGGWGGGHHGGGWHHGRN